MAKEVVMPKFGFTQETAEIVRWLKQPGEKVEQGDPIAEVTTDKINMEVEAPASGILDGLQYPEGAVVPVTLVIAYILSPGEAIPGVALKPAPTSALPLAEESEQSSKRQVTPLAQRVAQAQGVNLQEVVGSGVGGRVTRRDVEDHKVVEPPSGKPTGKLAAVPAARRLAGELGVELASVVGSGPDGRIQSVDVRFAYDVQSRSRVEAPRGIPSPAPISLPSLDEISERIPLAGMRRMIAERLQRSAQEAPHITLDMNVDVSAAERLRNLANQRLPEGAPRISLTAVIAKACAWALQRNPWVNSRLAGEEILLMRSINLGIAVALENGLIVPVVHSAESKGILQIGQEIQELVEKARLGRLLPDDVADGTFTISNMGMFGIDRFTAIINPPQAAILAVGRVSKRFIPDENDQPVLRPIMTITICADHRVVDGAIAAYFLRDVRQSLETPDVMTL